MKRMNLKKAISLLTFLLVMVIGTTAIAQDATPFNKLKEEIKSIEKENNLKSFSHAEINASTATLKISLLNSLASAIERTPNADSALILERMFGKFDAMEDSDLKTQVLVIKQEIIELLN